VSLATPAIGGSGLRHTSRGSISIEAVLIIPAFLLFLALIAAIGRTAAVRADVHASVVEGARIASMQTGSVQGQTAAEDAIRAHLAQEGVTCLRLDISINSQALDLPPGQPGSVSATVTCVVPLADLAVPGLPGDVTITESFDSALDTYTIHTSR